MQIPQITASWFLLLSPLLDGRLWRAEELIEATGWTTTQEDFVVKTKKLHRDGLIEKALVTRPGQRRRLCYRITEAGRRVWRETLDFYLHVAQRFPADRAEPADPALSIRVVPAVYVPDGPDRRPTVEEESRILAQAPPQLTPPYRLIHGLDLSPVVVASLDVSDVDLAAGTLRIPGRELPLDDPELARLLAGQIAGRSRGPLFLPPSGQRWTASALSRVFSTARDRAGVPRDVKLCGRRWFGGRASDRIPAKLRPKRRTKHSAAP